MKKLLIGLIIGVATMFTSCSDQVKDISYDLYLKGEVSVDGNKANVDWKFNSDKGEFQKQLNKQYAETFPGAPLPEPMKMSKSEFQSDSEAIGTMVDHYFTSASKTRANVLYNVTFGGKVGVGPVQWRIPELVFSNMTDSTAVKVVDESLVDVPSDSIK